MLHLAVCMPSNVKVAVPQNWRRYISREKGYLRSIYVKNQRSNNPHYGNNKGLNPYYGNS